MSAKASAVIVGFVILIAGIMEKRGIFSKNSPT
jgi:uncharacterized membrane protein HdeD (DUF308 family)